MHLFGDARRMREQHVVEIARPPEHVFAYLDDPKNAPKWAEGIVSYEFVDEKSGRVGSRYRMVVREGRSNNEYQGEIVAWERGRRLRSTATRNGQAMTLDQSVEPLPGERTRLTHAAEIELRGPAVLMSPLVRLFFRMTLRKQARKVKELLEAPAP